jgi:hypothetical protein
MKQYLCVPKPIFVSSEREIERERERERERDVSRESS